jgi:signal transduction histidine kinase/CheY-like chemotaxis protein
VRTCLDATTASSLVWGPELTLVYNDAFATLLGPNHPHALGRSAKLGMADAWEVLRPLVEGGMRGAPSTLVDCTLDFAKRSDERFFVLSCAPIADEEGTVLGVSLSAAETTARVRAARRFSVLEAVTLQTKRARSAGEVASIAAGVLAGAPGEVPFALFYLLAAGGVEARLAGVVGVEPRGDANPSVVKLDDPKARWPFASVARSGSAALVELPPLGPRAAAPSAGNGPRPRAHALVVPLPFPGRTTPAGFLVAGANPIASDSDERFLEAIAACVGSGIASASDGDARAETATVEEILHRERDARSAAEQANRAKDEFLAMLGHELRNPLAPILPALDLVTQGDAEDAVRARAVIERQVGHMVRLIDDLLDVSRIKRGELVLKSCRMELADAVGRGLEMASPLLEEREQELTIDVPRRGLAVDGDAARLAQVVSNLVTNASKYTPRCGSIGVKAAIDGSQVVLLTTDSGIGMSSEILQRIFEPFVQERQSIDRAQGGLGLGLAIVRSIVSAHGGTVCARSAGVGCGSEFEVRLPRAQGPRQVETPLDLPRVVPAVAPRRILVVDDNEDAAYILSRHLCRRGHTLEVAHDAASALRVAKSFMPEVGLLDIGLPVVDGYELARRLLQMPGLDGLYLVAVTGYGLDTDRERSQKAGFRAHLVKPIAPTVLEELLRGIAAARG